MKSVGIIAEYNPFHKGHLYHLNKVKEMFPETPIILILIGNFTERGDMSVINKWDKTKIALDYGINLVIEMPFIYCIQSADMYASHAIELLKELHVENIVFGSEMDDINLLTKLASMMKSKKYNNMVKYYLDKGVSYPTAISNSLMNTSNIKIDSPNDLLGLSYIQEINKQHAKIKPITIKRTDDYHISASKIRSLIKEGKSIDEYVPKGVSKYVKPKFIENYYPLLKYKILTEINNLEEYQLVDEGIENRIKKYINKSNSLEDLITNIKTKRYTYNRIKRMLTNILCNLKKSDMKKHNEYIRVLGFDKIGREYLKQVKTKLKVVTKYSTIKSSIFEKELVATSIYDSELLLREYQKPIIKE